MMAFPVLFAATWVTLFKAFCPLQYREVPLSCDTDSTPKKCGVNTVGKVEPAVLVRGKNYPVPKSHAAVIY